LKQEAREFIQDLLSNAGCKNVHIVGENIRCQCPFHWPERNTDAFSISFNPNDGFGFHCFSLSGLGKVNEENCVPSSRSGVLSWKIA
jgi:hypothetical protein